MKCFVTGGAGFIGSHLVEGLLSEGHDVVIYDNLSTGTLRNFRWFPAQQPGRCAFVNGDIESGTMIYEAMKGCDVVFHLAANADVRYGLDHPRLDLEANTIGTFNVLEAMRETGIKRIVFTSTGSVYGKATIFPTPEEAPFPIQTSLYGASKLAAEGLVQAYCEGYGFQGWIFRLVGVLGERYSHGHVLDFYRQLKANPHHLKVLGDGFQRKSYVYVKDVVSALLLPLSARTSSKVKILNVGTDEYCSVRQSITWICSYMGLDPEIEYDDEDRGWAGDNPFIWLNCLRLQALGWQPSLTILLAVRRTLDYLTADCLAREE